MLNRKTRGPSGSKSILLALAIIFLFACAPAKKVMRKGVMMPEDQAVKLDLHDADKLFNAKKYRDALLSYEMILKKYQGNNTASQALYKSARIYRRQRKYENSRKALEKLVVDFPLSPVMNEAKFELGRLYYRKKMYDEAKNAFLGVNVDYFAKDKRVRILRTIRKTLKITDSYLDLIKCDIKIYDNLTDFAAIADIKKEIFDTIDTRLDEETLEKLSDERRGRYPGDLAKWKLTKLIYHKGDKKEGRNHLISFLKNYPLSEYYTEAHDLYLKLSKKKAPEMRSIGVLLPLSGPNAIVGEIALKGIWLATGLLEKSSGKYDDFKIIIRDTAGNPDVASKAFDELVLESNVIGIIGPMLSKTSEVVALKAQKYQIPVILLNQNEDIIQIGDYIFRNFISKNQQARTLAKFAIEKLKIKRFAFLYPLHKYGTSFVSAFWDELDKYKHVEVRGVQSYEPDSNDFSKPIKKLVGLDNLDVRKEEICKDENDPRKLPHDDIESTQASETDVCYNVKKLPPIIEFEALLIPDNYEKIIQVAPSLLYYDVKGIQLIGGNLWDSEDIFKENTGKYLQGSILTDAFFKKSKRPESRAFIKDFKAAFADEPDIIASHAFESASVMLQAIEELRPASSNDLKEILLKKNDFKTISGARSFSEDRNLNHELSVLIIDGDEIKELY